MFRYSIHLFLLILLFQQHAYAQSDAVRILNSLYVLPDARVLAFDGYDFDDLLNEGLLIDVSAGDRTLPSGRLLYIFQFTGPDAMRITKHNIRIKINKDFLDLEEHGLRIANNRIYLLNLSDNVNVMSEVTLEIRTQQWSSDRRTWKISGQVYKPDDSAVQTVLIYDVAASGRTEVLPCPSPMGNYIGYTIPKDKQNQIYIKKLSPQISGAEDHGILVFRSVSKNKESPFGLCWSPDENTIAYTRQEEGDFELFLQTDIIDAVEKGSFCSKAVRVTRRKGSDDRADFSPDGQHLIFLSSPAEGDSGSDQYLSILEYRTGKPRVVERIRLDGIVIASPLRYAPDGLNVVFEARNPEHQGKSDIYLLDVTTTDITNITETADISEQYPSWSPNGERIAFYSNRGEHNLRISVLDVQSKRFWEVAEHVQFPEDSHPPVWGLNGEVLYYFRTEGEKEISTARCDLAAGIDTQLLVGTSHLTTNRSMASTCQDHRQLLLVNSYSGDENIYCAELDSVRAGDVVLSLPPNLGVYWENRYLGLSPAIEVPNGGLLVQNPTPGANRLRLHGQHTLVYDGIIPVAGTQAHPYTVRLSPETIVVRDLMPKSLLKTAILPGWGQLDQKRVSSGLVLSTCFLTFLGSAIHTDLRASSLYDDYLALKAPVAIYPKRMAYQRSERLRDAFYTAAFVTWGVSMIDYLWGPSNGGHQLAVADPIDAPLISGPEKEPLGRYSSSETELAIVASEPRVDVYIQQTEPAGENWRYFGTTGTQYARDGGLIIRGLTSGEYRVKYVCNDGGNSYLYQKSISLEPGMRTWAYFEPSHQSEVSTGYRFRQWLPGVHQYVDRKEKLKGSALLLAEASLIALTISHYILWGNQLDDYNSATDVAELTTLKYDYKRSKNLTYSYGISALLLYGYHLWDVFFFPDSRANLLEEDSIPIEWLTTTGTGN